MSVTRWNSIASKSIWRGIWDIVVVNVDLNVVDMLHMVDTGNVHTVMFIKDCICALSRDRMCRNADVNRGLELTTTFEVQFRVRSQSMSDAVIQVSGRFGNRIPVTPHPDQQIKECRKEDRAIDKVDPEGEGGTLFRSFSILDRVNCFGTVGGK